MECRILLDEHVYSLENQKKFAELSGDYNPMHVDPLIARREKFGEIVVHGVYSLTKCLDAFSRHLIDQGMESIAIKNISARFTNPVFLNKTISNVILDDDPTNTRLGVFDGVMLLTEVKLTWERQKSRLNEEVGNSRVIKSPIKDKEIESLKDAKGDFELSLERSLTSLLFPDLQSVISRELIATLFSLTRIVGMECPGLQSIFSSFKLKQQEDDNIPPGMINYHAFKVIPKYSKIDISVQTINYTGVANAFYRPRPIKQATFNEVQKSVKLGLFKNQVALIIGGSRGLGEITAKIIAAGGGLSIITYHKGKEDADKIFKEITEAGGRCKTVHLNVTDPSEQMTMLKNENLCPSHIYYFASGRIAQPREQVFEMDQFLTFSKMYLGAFFDLYRQYRACWGSNELVMFYPSSVFVDSNSKHIEYSITKHSGELLSKYLEQQDSALKIYVERLPRLLTDQNLGFNYQQIENPLEVMQNVLYKMN